MKNASLHTVNVLDSGVSERRLWRFETERGALKLRQEAALPPGQALPAGAAAKSWSNLWKPKLNIAWLSGDQIFLRVIQLPQADHAETLSMLEFQLEKLSPLPVAQIVWSAEFLPSAAENMQTAIVVIAPRELVESFLGKLEADGYLADRLEIPGLNQLIAQAAGARPGDALSSRRLEDGVWLYPDDESANHLCLAAWWSDGTLQNLQLLPTPLTENRAALIEDQLLKTAWAGEMEGWLRFPIRRFLVADQAAAMIWAPLLSAGGTEKVTVYPALSKKELAQLSAERPETNRLNLLPPEFGARYRQQYFDRLWMRGLGGLMMAYIAGVMLYLGAVQVVKWQRARLQSQVTALSGSYTNTLQLKERVQILEDQLNLKYAALDSWKVASELLPQELTLSWLVFSRAGTTPVLTLHGTAPQDAASKLTDFNEALRNARVADQPLFSQVDPPTSNTRGAGPGATLAWTFKAELSRVFE